jgi:hypothetical protein
VSQKLGYSPGATHLKLSESSQVKKKDKKEEIKTKK